MAQWLDEGYFVDEVGIGGSAFFQRLQIRRIGDWVQFRGHVEWDGNVYNPHNPAPVPTDDLATSLVTTGDYFSHGPLPEEYRPPGAAHVSVVIDPQNYTGTVPDGGLPKTQTLRIFSNGVCEWWGVNLGGGVGFLEPLAVWWFDGLTYYVGDDNAEQPPGGYVQHWPNP